MDDDVARKRFAILQITFDNEKKQCYNELTNKKMEAQKK